MQNANIIILLLLSCLIVNGCQSTHEATKHDQESDFGAYGASLDGAKWTWIDNRDGRKLLKHKTVPDCYVGYNTEPLGYELPGFSMAKETKMIHKGKYDVFTVTENGKFYCITYSRQKSKSAHDLTVYAVNAGGRCQEEAEAIIFSYEKSMSSDK